MPLGTPSRMSGATTAHLRASASLRSPATTTVRPVARALARPRRLRAAAASRRVVRRRLARRRSRRSRPGDSARSSPPRRRTAAARVASSSRGIATGSPSAPHDLGSRVEAAPRRSWSRRPPRHASRVGGGRDRRLRGGGREHCERLDLAARHNRHAADRETRDLFARPAAQQVLVEAPALAGRGDEPAHNDVRDQAAHRLCTGASVGA